MAEGTQNLLRTGPEGARAHLVLAHGAGAPMTSPFMVEIADLLAARGIAIVRFEFAYMAARREGRRLPPPPMPRLLAEYRQAIASVAGSLQRGTRLLIGGKSMGGRAASMIADEQHGAGRVAGLVCLGYPFHPPGKPESLRTAHLADLECPALIVQGERDPFGTTEDVAGYALSPAIRIAWMPDGDHDLKPRRASGRTHGQNLAAAADAIAAFADM